MFSTFCVCLGLSCILIGCSQPRPFDDLWIQERPYQAQLTAVRPPADSLDDRATAANGSEHISPSGEITLADAVALALKQNHALGASGWSVTAAKADALQFAQPRNPTASFAVDNFAGPDASDTFQRQTLKISQVIELAGKRDKRRKLGQAIQRHEAWNYESLRLDIASQTASRYVAVVVSQQRVALTQKQLELAEASYAIAEDRVNNEVAPGLERDQAAVRVALNQIALEQAKRDLDADRADLAAMWGGEVAEFDSASGALNQRNAVPGLDQLKQLATANPSIARWDNEFLERQAALELEQAKATTDPTIGAGIRYFSDAEDIAGIVDINWPLAVFDDNRFAILSARLRLAQVRDLKEQALAETHAALARAHARLQAAAYATKTLEQNALPAAQSAYEAALDNYRAGQSDYLTVLDAERSLLDIRNTCLDAELAYHQSIISIERLTAHPIDAIQNKP